MAEIGGEYRRRNGGEMTIRKRRDRQQLVVLVDNYAAKNWGDGCVGVLMRVVFVSTLGAA